MARNDMLFPHHCHSRQPGARVARHYHIERVPAIIMAAKIATTIAQVAIVGGMLLGILYGIYALDIVVQP